MSSNHLEPKAPPRRTQHQVQLVLSLAVVCLRVASAQGTAFGAAYQQPVPLVAAPGQLVTVYANVGNPDGPLAASRVPLPITLGPFAVAATDVSAPSGLRNLPILSAFPVDTGPPMFLGVTIGGAIVTGITVQIPYEFAPGLGTPDSKSRILLGISADAPPNPQTNYPARMALILQSDAIHILRSGDTITSPADAHGGVGVPPKYLPPVVSHADGSYVTPDHPAHPGETVSIWAVGLGLPSSGTVKTGEANPSPPLTTTVGVDFEFRSNAGPSMPSATNSGGSHVPATKIPAYFAPGFVGLYQINVTIPQPPVPLESCGGVFQSNVTVNIGGTASYDGAGICVTQ